MRTAQRFLILFFIFFVSDLGWALQGAGSLEERLLKGHLEIQVLESEIKSQESLVRSSQSGYYPTINAVGGWQQDKELSVGDYKGAVGYIDGKWNLFHGFRDQSISNQASADVEIKRNELETKKRTLKSELTDVLSDMIYTHQLVVLLDEESKLTQVHRQMAAKKVSAGLTGAVDNVEFDLRDSEIEIQKRVLAQQHLEAHQKLKTLFGEEIKDEELARLKFDEFSAQKSNFPGWDKTRSLSVQKSKILLARAEAEKVQARSDFLPSLDFEYRFGHLTPGETDTVKFDESRYGLLLTIPLFSGFETAAKTRAQVLNVSAKEKSLAQFELEFES
jgi:outer membrane protein